MMVNLETPLPGLPSLSSFQNINRHHRGTMCQDSETELKRRKGYVLPLMQFTVQRIYLVTVVAFAKQFPSIPDL